MSTDEQHDAPETDVRDSNPNAAGPAGLEGDLGVSSERTGSQGTNPATRGVRGTGSHGSAPHGTDGLTDTSRGEGPREHAEEPAEGPDGDEGSEQERTASEEPAEGPDDPEHTGSSAASPSSVADIDRTVGEVQPDEVTHKHSFDPSRNPGH